MKIEDNGKATRAVVDIFLIRDPIIIMTEMISAMIDATLNIDRLAPIWAFATTYILTPWLTTAR